MLTRWDSLLYLLLRWHVALLLHDASGCPFSLRRSWGADMHTERDAVAMATGRQL